ncbi:tyrosine-type recombinase/integrase [Fluoribacter dumoffii]|uniref:Tyrosine recombinase XerD n=1 Tax=Fluoribacter dumoffii TaxID=463 RepID=A0A377IUA3_9GAMM|nr:site-specific integrase [Fluoribacter dumoffii]KTC88887.1 Tyrosine recombinase XerD [Fluoribacter dumoffii NY 23]STO91405.1 Tyrosine recombinase XerD [Fluoribacter dumoffii]STO91524.1 Tyrosine recombinase XerD [Fluoribacter dumoffii]STO91769.1 Tyrosine recombinase XerD [Fluoribacter dumoffii]
MENKSKAKILSVAEFERLLAITRKGSFPVRNVAILYCSFGLGLKVKEISSLTIDDISDAQNRLREEVHFKRSTGNGVKIHRVYLTNKKVFNALMEHLEDMKDVARNRPFFQSQRKKEFTPNTLQKLFRKLYDDAGLSEASSHSGRRTFITRLLEHGISVKAVSSLAGHSNISTTAIYAKDNLDCLRNIANLAVL